MAAIGRNPTLAATKQLEINPRKRSPDTKEPKTTKKAPICQQLFEPEAKNGYAVHSLSIERRIIERNMRLQINTIINLLMK